MTRKRGKPFSRKIKRRAPIRQRFYDEYVKDSQTVHAVRFSHRDGKDFLIVTCDRTHKGQMPTEYEGFPVKFFLK